MKSPASPTELAELARAIFVVDARGRTLLEHLERRFCTVTPVVTEGGIDAVLQTYQRAAHRELLDYIHTLIARAEVGSVETPETKLI